MKEYIVQAIAQETIDSFDAHNAPELIRCKDCIYGDDFDCPAPLPTGYLCQKGHGSHTGDWFCADGKREGGR